MKELLPSIETEKVNNALKREVEDILETLIKKNTQYDNAALTPFNVFSTSDAIEKIRVRIDDKLARIRNAFKSDSMQHFWQVEDSIRDLIGYLLLYRVAETKQFSPSEAMVSVVSDAAISVNNAAYDPFADIRQQLAELQSTVFSDKKKPTTLYTHPDDADKAREVLASEFTPRPGTVGGSTPRKASTRRKKKAGSKAATLKKITRRR